MFNPKHQHSWTTTDTCPIKDVGKTTPSGYLSRFSCSCGYSKFEKIDGRGLISCTVIDNDGNGVSEFKKGDVEMKKKHYEKLAEILGRNAASIPLVEDLCRYLIEENKQFDREKFTAAIAKAKGE